MATLKQQKANKLNSLKGGVKTHAGKEVSKMNALKYGFFSKIVTQFDKLDNSDFCNEIYNCFNPINEYEKQLVEILLSNLLTFRRICFIEKEFIETKLNPDVKMDFEVCIKEGYKPVIELNLLDDLNKFQKYKTSIQNNIIKIQHELERLINNRYTTDKIIPNSVDINVLTTNGFVLEN